MTLLEEQEEKPNLESPALNCGMETSIRAERQAVGVEPLAGSSPAPTTEECPVCSADIFAAPAAVLDPCGHFFHGNVRRQIRHLPDLQPALQTFQHGGVSGRSLTLF